jgi:Holliday junction resolvase RusA-like endonuclease
VSERRDYLNGHWVSAQDFEFRFVITGKPAVLKNSKVIVTKPFPRLLPSKASKAWTKAALAQLPRQKSIRQPLPVEVTVNAAIVTYAHDRRERDLDNSLGGPLDALVSAGVLTTDSNKQVKSLDGSRLLYDKANPRVEITLTPYLESP